MGERPPTGGGCRGRMVVVSGSTRRRRTMTASSREDAAVAIEGDGVELRMLEVGGGMTGA